MSKTYFLCQRCKQFSGDDWSQCFNSCPVEQSPHFDPAALTYYGPLVEMTEEQYQQYMQDEWRRL